MVTKYPSKVSYGLLLFIFAVFYGPILAELIGNGYGSAMLGVALFLTPIFGLVVHMLFSTTYTIEHEKLHVRCGFFSYKPIAITDIKKIAPTKTFIASPAPSFDRIEIRYGKFDSVVISPKDQTAFVQHVMALNPAIQTHIDTNQKAI